MRPPPRITVVTPSLNQAVFIERAITSVLDQGYPNLEYIIMDGGSTDGSVDIIRRYSDRVAFWTSGPDGGQSAAINAGWRRSTGEILAWLNSDDSYLPGALNWAAEFFNDHPRAWVGYGSAQVVDVNRRQLGMAGSPYRRTAMILSGNTVPQPAAFIRREALECTGMLDESLHYLMDMDLFLRIGRVRAPVFTDRPVAVMTVHKDAKTVRHRRHMARERSVVRLRHARWYERPVLFVLWPVSRAMHASPTLLALVDRIRANLRSR